MSDNTAAPVVKSEHEIGSGMSKKQAKEVALKALDMVGLKGAEKINPYEFGYRDAFLSPEEFVAYKKANA